MKKWRKTAKKVEKNSGKWRENSEKRVK